MRITDKTKEDEGKGYQLLKLDESNSNYSPGANTNWENLIKSKIFIVLGNILFWIFFIWHFYNSLTFNIFE